RGAQAAAAARPRGGDGRRQGPTQPPAQADARGPRAARARRSGLAPHACGDRPPGPARRRRPVAAGPARAELNARLDAVVEEFYLPSPAPALCSASDPSAPPRAPDTLA